MKTKNKPKPQSQDVLKRMEENPMNDLDLMNEEELAILKPQSQKGAICGDGMCPYVPCKDFPKCKHTHSQEEENKIFEEVRIHRGFAEFEEAKERGINIRQLFGKYQHIFSSKKGKISLVLLKDYLFDGNEFWEIYCLEGNLFEDTERFDTKEKAVEKIREILK